MNEDLGLNKIDKYLPFIKNSYEGFNLGALSLAGAKISKDEIYKLKIMKKRLIIYLMLLYSSNLFIFSKSKSVAIKFLEQGYCAENLFRALYIIKNMIN